MPPVIAFFFTAWLLLATLLALPHEQGSAEPVAPSPSPVLQSILNELDQHSKAQHPQEALAAADRALRVALENQDAVGTAYAQRGRARALEALRRTAEAVSAWREAAAAWARLEEGPEQIEALAALAVQLDTEQPEEAAALRAQALRLGQSESKRPLAAAEVLWAAGWSSYERRYLDRAREFWLVALSIRERQAPNSLETAASLNSLGNVAGQQGDLRAARQYHQRALAIREERAPHSLEMATSLNNLGNVASKQGDLRAADEYYRRALAIQEEKAPNSLKVAMTLGNLGVIVGQQGDLRAARQYHQRALAIHERRAPNSLEMTASLGNLGNVAFKQGDLRAAREYLQRALAIQEEKAPNSLEMAASLNSLGNVAFNQGDLRAARQYHQGALAIRERRAPNSLEMAASLGNLGNVAFKQGDLQAAGEYYRRALAIQEEKAPNSLEVAMSLGNLGNVTGEQGDLQAARQYHQGALAIRERRAPNSLEMATSLGNLGNVAFKQGDLRAAREYLQRALAIREERAPNALDTALNLSNLGKLEERQGHRAEAKQYFWRAWQVVREQREALFGDEAMQAFGTSTLSYATDLIRHQIRLGELEAAFTTLEESRAQALQQLLFERSTLARGIESKAWLEYQAATRARDRAEQALSRAGVAEALARRKLADARQAKAVPATLAKMQAEHDAAQRQMDEAQAAYTQARIKADERWAELKQSAPRAFAPPLNPKQAIGALPAGTLFIAFAVGDEQTYVFLLRAGREAEPLLSVYPLVRPRQELQPLVNQFRRQVAAPNRPAAATEAGRSLFAALFSKEARPMIAEARRLLISPDGPLWELPFAALVSNTQGTPKYLGLEKPITYTPSLTLFAQARHDPPSLTKGSKPSVLVVGHPIFDRQTQPAVMAALPRDRPRGERSDLWPNHRPPAPLPGTGAEAVQIARLYGSAALTQEAATEAAVRQRIETADVIHFATHGYLHPTRAMSSGILLTAPEREPDAGDTNDDGVLQAWEIHSQLKLKAELVVLSACDTGRGEYVRGEGLVGLTRALQYAGARAILTSHWAVNDESTRRLMEAFHRHVREGLAKDEALRRAMALVRAGKRTGHPYYWAAFFLTGDPDNPNLASPDRRRP